MPFDTCQQIERLLHRHEASLSRRFLAEAHEGSAHERLQVLVLLHAEPETDMPERVGEQPWIGLSVQLRKF